MGTRAAQLQTSLSVARGSDLSVVRLWVAISTTRRLKALQDKPLKLRSRVGMEWRLSRTCYLHSSRDDPKETMGLTGEITNQS